MKKLLLAAMLALLVSATFADAQQMPPGKWWRRPEVIKQIGLSTEQQDRLDEIFRKNANDLIDLKGEVEKQQVSLRGELERTPLRRAEIQKIAERLNEYRGKLFAAELMMLVDMRGVLTENQWDRAKQLFERIQEQRRDNRENRGDPMRPGPPPGGGRRP